MHSERPVTAESQRERDRHRRSAKQRNNATKNRGQTNAIVVLYRTHANNEMLSIDILCPDHGSGVGLGRTMHPSCLTFAMLTANFATLLDSKKKIA
jgi:hypothetical protein